MTSRRHTIRRGGSRRGGFTLIEAALTTVIIGTGVLAIVSAQEAYHMKNDWAQRTGNALQLANELRELTLTLPLHDPITGAANLGPEANEADVTAYDDVDDFAGAIDGAGMGAGTTFSPPINALRQVIPNMEGWSQVIMVENVLPGNISPVFTQPLGTTDLVRVTVSVRFGTPGSKQAPSTITTLSWIVGE